MNKKMVLLTILILSITLVIIFVFKNKSKSKADVVTIEYLPFTILKTSTENKSFNMNHGRMLTITYSDYTVLFKGASIQFPANLEQNTGLSGVWKAYILKGAPKPTILASSQSLYLKTEENDSIIIRPLNEQNSEFASLQSMDENNGQPGLN